jgi:CRISPR-associated endonuclease/helicase Cas3
MTATLPHAVKHYLFKFVEERGKLRELKDLRPPLRRSIKYSPLFKDNQTISHLIKSNDFLKKVKEHQKTLLVLNTVGKAIDVFQRLRPIVRKLGIEPMLIHSRMTASARAERESELAKMRENTEYNKIVVSTQVAESGLDVSFDLLITELAPPEALVQRSGRCARRGGNGELLIVQPAGEYYYQPYQKELIDCTKDVLKKFDIDFGSSFDLQSFIDDVYEKLPSEYSTPSDSSMIDKTLSYFSVWTNPLLRPPPQNVQVREGLPVTLCHLPDEELSVLLNRKEAEYIGEAVKKIIQRCFTLDFDVINRHREIIEHNIDGSKILVGFTIYSQRELEDGKPIKLMAKVERIKSLSSVLTKNYSLLINPCYYKIEDSYELGLILTRHVENKQ